MSEFLVINESNFEETIKANKYVLVDFWATWCNPCRMLLPIMEAFAKDNEGIVVGKINIDESAYLAEKFGVMTIPTVILFVDGEPKDKFVGFRQKAQISAFVEKNRA